MSEKNIQYEMLEGLINSLAKRIDNLDTQLRHLSNERDCLFRHSKELNDLIKLMKFDSKKLYEDFLGYFDEIEEQGLSIEEIRDNIKEKMK